MGGPPGKQNLWSPLFFCNIDFEDIGGLLESIRRLNALDFSRPDKFHAEICALYVCCRVFSAQTILASLFAMVAFNYVVLVFKLLVLNIKRTFSLLSPQR